MEMRELLIQMARVKAKLEVKDGRLHVNAPEGALTPALRDAIRKNRDRLISVLSEPKLVRTDDKPDQIVPDAANRHQEFPLNDVQHAYFIGRQFGIELGNVATHFYYELECVDLDLDRLGSSFLRVIAHHGMLRSTVSPDGQQRILPTVPDYEIAIYDLRGEPAEEQERQTGAIRAEMSQQVLPADTWPLFDIRAARLSARNTRLYFSWDCLVVDAWSLSIIFRQWYACYSDPGYALPQLDVSFRDYILAELALKESERYRRAREYWWQRIDALPPAPILPIDRKIDRAKRYSFNRRKHHLGPAKWRALKRHAQKAGLTPTSFLLAAFCDVLTFWSKKPHYCLNLTLFNRLPLHEQVNDLVGDFTSLSVLEVDGRKGGSFRERALLLQKRFLRDLEHREVNGVEVLRELAKRREYQGKAIMPIVFTSTLMVGADYDQDMGVLQKFGDMGYGLSQTPQVLLDYQIFERGGELFFNWDSVDELFLPGVLDDMFLCHCELLDHLATNQDAWSDPIVVKLPDAQRRILRAMNATDAETSDELLHTAFVERALSDPGRIAVECSAGQFSYGELLAYSDQVARRLLAHDVKPNELVAVVMEKGWEQLVAVLGILISGAAYLPIHPDLPERRRERLLEQGEARIAITQARLAEGIGWPEGLHRVVVSRQDRIEALSSAPPQRQRKEDLAYVIFTSGSTGTPKGVMIDHQAAVNTIVHINRLFDVGSEDKVLAVSSLSFDLSVYDVFGLLAVGGCVVIPDGKSEREAAHWQKLCLQHGVTIWNSAPPLMDMLADYVENQERKSLGAIRLAMLSGDWIATSLPDRIRSLTEEPLVISLGGATEGSIWSIYYPIAPDVPESWQRIPYGKPLPNQHMYVLNADLEECPFWVVGDIYIGGKGVALGYWKDEERSAERFRTHPRSGERLYWTGDLGRYFPDGNIEFLGREDQQVKLHGHRVELGEITANLQSHPDVDDGVVLLLKDGDRSVLTAYVVPAANDRSGLFEVEGIPEPTADAAWQAMEAHGRRGLAEYCKTHHELLASFDELWRRAERLCKLGMADALRRLGVFSAGLREGELAECLTGAGVVPRHVPLVRQWLEVLKADGMVAEQAASVSLTDKASPQAFAAASQALADFAEQTPTCRNFHRYIETCLRKQVELLKNEISALEILFPDGSWNLAEALYESNPVAAGLSRSMAGALKGLIGSWQRDKAIRILEVGAGTGGASGALLPELPADRTEYWYTDLSNFFLSGAKEKFKQYPFIKHGMYDINKTAAEQGYHAHSFDVIVADNVLHNGTDVEEVLSELRTLLKPGGHLLVLEGTENTPWQMVTVAYLESFGEHDAGTRHEEDLPLLTAEEWLHHLENAGYEKIATFPESRVGPDAEPGPGETSLRRSMPQHVIVAQAPRSVRKFTSLALAEYLGARLPEYMVPAEFVRLDALPLSVNGKVDLKALPKPQQMRQARERKITAPKTETEQAILAIWRDVLGIDQIGVNENFFEMGGDSLLVTRVLGKINASMGCSLTSADFFAYPTVQSLTRYLTADGDGGVEAVEARVRSRPGAERSRDVAIVGMAGRFPDAPNVRQFWDNVRSARCSIRYYSDDELLESGVDAETLKDGSYVKAGVPLADVDLFDAGFFGMSPREAEIMDPQQRFLLECSVEALEHAGHVNEETSGRIGVFVGKDTSRYLLYHLLPQPKIMATMGTLAIMNVNEKDYAATQISYRLNLTGPSLNVNTACSSSLVAVHEACKSLLDGECDVALAGGVSIDVTQPRGYFYRKGYIASPDGCCRAFSADANGTVGGSGVALVVLRPLDEALAAGDQIHAVIKGSAINNDGSLKVAYSAPSVNGQAQVIADALAVADVDPSTIGYVEAHGTGTKLGDPVEIAALNRVYGKQERGRCAIGSVKTNVGHLDAAAGAAGLIKVVESLKHRHIPPSLHFSAPNPAIDFDGGPFYVNTKLRPWEAGATPRRAAVSSFGVGGTNAHVILEEAPAAAEPAESETAEELLVMSAKRPDSLKGMVEDLGNHLEAHRRLPMADVAFTLQVGRNAYSSRTFMVCDGVEEAVGRLANPESLVIFEKDESRTPSVVFMFPGQGTQDFDLTWDVYREEAVFRKNLDACAEILTMFIGADIRGIVYPQWPEAAAGDPAGPDRTAFVQPVLFALEYSLAKWWQSVGVEPEGMIGHSLGEYVAACLAGVLTLEEALSLMVVRGQLMQTMEAGRMAAVGLPETELASLLAPTRCDLAAVNGPEQCVISGTEDEVSRICETLTERGVRARMLNTDRAFHSRMMEPILGVYQECLEQVQLNAPAIPFISNVTGRWITAEEATSPAYWVRHLRHTVRFSDGVSELLSKQGRILLEVGPGSTLSGLAKAQGPVRHRVVTTFGVKTQTPRRSLLNAVGELWARGVSIEWMELRGKRRPRRVPLPTYRFDRKRYWVPRDMERAGAYGGTLAMDAQDLGDARLPDGDDHEPETSEAPPLSRESGLSLYPRPYLETPYVAPEKDIERKLADIWRQFIGVATIGIEDNFFELGGDSLTATQAIALISREFETEVPIEKMFELVTIRKLASYISLFSGELDVDSLSEEELDRLLEVAESSGPPRRLETSGVR